MFTLVLVIHFLIQTTQQQLSHIYKRFLYLRKCTKIIIEKRNYKTFIADIRISTTENNSNTPGKNTAAVKVLVQHKLDVFVLFLTINY